MASRTSLRTSRLTVTSLEDRLTPAVTLRFDTRFDTSGFYQRSDVMASLQRAADQITTRLSDNLAAVNPGGANTWTATALNPVTGRQITVPNLAVGENELVVFLAAGNIGGSELGIASSGGFSAAGAGSWLSLIRGRGQAVGSDTGPWGGMLAFDTGTNWHFGAEAPPSGRFDFSSVATHELMHLFGFGLDGASYTRYVSGSSFVGPTSTAVYGGAVPMDGDHIAGGTTTNGQESVMVPVIPAGVRRTMTSLDYALLQDMGWQVGGAASPTPPAGPSLPTLPPVALPVGATPGTTLGGTVDTEPLGTTPATSAATAGTLPFTVGIGAGVQNTAFVYRANESAPSVVTAPFGAGFTGGVRVATADVDGDGLRDTVLGTGPGAATRVVVLSGATGATLADFAPFEAAFTGGVFVTAGDVDGDGKAEIIVTPDEGGGPRVVVLSGTGAVRGSFFAFTDDPNFRGGARAAAGDLNGDGVDDIAVAAGFGGGPRVALFDGRAAATGVGSRLGGDFFAFEQTLRNGIYVAITDLNGDGRGDLVAGAGPGGGPRVTVFSGAALLAGSQVAITNFFAGPESNRGGVRVAATERNADAVPDVVTGAGEGGDGAVRLYSGADLLSGGTSPFATLADASWQLPGVYVG